MEQGTILLSRYGNCPKCGTSWADGKYSRLIDVFLSWGDNCYNHNECPDCGQTFSRVEICPFSKEKIPNKNQEEEILKKCDEYFATTPKKEIAELAKEITKLGTNGITIKQYLDGL